MNILSDINDELQMYVDAFTCAQMYMLGSGLVTDIMPVVEHSEIKLCMAND